jgi:hypothetical protein
MHELDAAAPPMQDFVYPRFYTAGSANVNFSIDDLRVYAPKDGVALSFSDGFSGEALNPVKWTNASGAITVAGGAAALPTEASMTLNQSTPTKASAIEFTVTMANKTADTFLILEFNETENRVSTNYPAFSLVMRPRDAGNMQSLRYYPVQSGESGIIRGNEAVLEGASGYNMSVNTKHDVRLELIGNTVAVFARPSGDGGYAYVGARNIPAEFPLPALGVYPRFVTVGGQYAIENVRIYEPNAIHALAGYRIEKKTGAGSYEEIASLSAAAGETVRVTADVVGLGADVSPVSIGGSVSIIGALYGSGAALKSAGVKTAQYTDKYLGDTFKANSKVRALSASVEFEVPAVLTAQYAKLLLWNGLINLAPLSPPIQLP